MPLDPRVVIFVTIVMDATSSYLALSVSENIRPGRKSLMVSMPPAAAWKYVLPTPHIISPGNSSEALVPEPKPNRYRRTVKPKRCPCRRRQRGYRRVGPPQAASVLLLPEPDMTRSLLAKVPRKLLLPAPTMVVAPLTVLDTMILLPAVPP